MKATVWKIRKGMDRRFRAGHPWVYSNELLDSPKGLVPGELVKLVDSAGKFLAIGFGNPHSLISFRAISRSPEHEEAAQEGLSESFLLDKLEAAGRLRRALGYAGLSHRLLFGEADGLPGLIIDHFQSPFDQKWVIQAHTAGADRLVRSGLLMNALEKYVTQNQNTQAWKNATILLRNDVAVRKLEGLEAEPVQVIKKGRDSSLEETSILIRSASGSHSAEGIPFTVDLIHGQKTGFFLDQFANIELATSRLQHWPSVSNSPKRSSLRILDLCSYVGQWGVQLGKFFQNQKVQVAVTAVDASGAALELAKKNLTQAGIACETLKMDVLKGLGDLSDGSFDLVISDPPALIKNRKDIPTGSHAYLQLNTQALRLTRPGGAFIACSCSSLLSEEVFSSILQKASQRNTAQMKWVGRGAQSPDHPILSEFPEGQYLKGWVGIRS